MPADTFRAWERRYGLPTPNRTDGNQRLYSERDIALIGWLRDHTKAGLTISQAVALYRVDAGEEPPRHAVTDVGANKTTGGRDVEPAAGGRLIEFRDRAVDALAAFDGERADRVVEEAVALLAVDDVCVHVLEAALVEVGERWRRGEMGVGAEHFASYFVMRKLAALFNLSQPQFGRGPIVAACVEGELHEIGLLLTCLFLSRGGFKIVYLGANLPLVDLLSVVQDLRPPLVLLSATAETHLERLTEAVAALRGSPGGDGGAIVAPMIGYGGRMFGERPELCDGIEAVLLGSDAGATVARVEQMLAKVPAPGSPG